ncbi:Ig-like domain-containing protein, partial [Chloroflexota bacterium]
VISGAVEGLTVVDTVSGEITYTPNLNYNGVDSFVYQICDDDGACNTATVGVTIDPVNDPPVALDDIAFTAEDTSESITVLDNDTDVDGNPLTVVAVGNAANGSTTTNGTVVTYDPSLNYAGTNTFTYTISDGSLQDTAMVTITVNGINDPPVARADAFSTAVNITLTVPAPGVLANDTDVDIGDTLTAVWVSDPVSGTLILNVDGSFVYVPNTGFIGVDTFIYRARDALMAPSESVTVTISVS